MPMGPKIKRKRKKRNRVVVSLAFLFLRLDGARRNHLLSEVVLVLGDGTIPRLDGLVVAYENLLGNLVQKSVETVSYCPFIAILGGRDQTYLKS
jgi:hypothetical protein